MHNSWYVTIALDQSYNCPNAIDLTLMIMAEIDTTKKNMYNPDMQL